MGFSPSPYQPGADPSGRIMFSPLVAWHPVSQTSGQILRKSSQERGASARVATEILDVSAIEKHTTSIDSQSKRCSCHYNG